MNLGIIGAGYSGTLLVSHFMRQARNARFREKLTIFLIEKGVFGPGVAYSTTSPAHLLKTAPFSMSLFPDDPDHFVRWAQKRDSTVQGDTSVPRRLFGEYLVEQLNEAEALQTADCRLVRVQGEVVAMEGQCLLLKDGRKLLMDRVILAMGNYPPPHPALRDLGFVAHPRYVRNPWTFDLPPSDESILILGTSLTMVDMALHLRQKGHRGKIHALSRHGLLPAEHRPFFCLENEVPFSFYTFPQPFPKKALAFLKIFRDEMRQANERGFDLDCVLFSALHQLHLHWRVLPVAEKNRFARHLRSYLNTYTNRIPFESDRALQQMIQEGQLQVHSGYLRKISQDLRVEFTCRHTQRPQTLCVDWVVNGLGAAKRFQDVEDPFLQSLFQKGVVRPNERGLILDTTSSFHVIDAHGNEHPHLFAFGAIKKEFSKGIGTYPMLDYAVELVHSLLLEVVDRSTFSLPTLSVKSCKVPC